jgi:adenosylcobinamide-GDP ribazoletransferase
MSAWHPPLVALQFLTRVPVRLDRPATDAEVGASMAWYPAVGIALGAVLALVAWLGADTTPLLRAALVLAVWVALTGALHLDGLADSADAWIGGGASAERTLTIMKDPRSGPIAVVVLVVVLLLKFAALASLAHDAWIAFVAVPLAGRAALPLLFVTTRYVREGGLGSVLAAHLPRGACTAAVAASAAVIAFAAGLAALAVAAVVFIACRHAMVRRIGGCTGDTAGATVELVETAALVALALR